MKTKNELREDKNEELIKDIIYPIISPRQCGTKRNTNPASVTAAPFMLQTSFILLNFQR